MDRTDDFLILRIVPQRIPILIAFEPLLVFISQRDGTAQPLQSLVALAFHCVGRSQPVSRVMIGVGGFLYFIGQLRPRFFAKSPWAQERRVYWAEAREPRLLL